MERHEALGLAVAPAGPRPGADALLLGVHAAQLLSSCQRQDFSKVRANGATPGSPFFLRAPPRKMKYRRGFSAGLTRRTHPLAANSAA